MGKHGRQNEGRATNGMGACRWVAGGWADVCLCAQIINQEKRALRRTKRERKKLVYIGQRTEPQDYTEARRVPSAHMG